MRYTLSLMNKALFSLSLNTNNNRTGLYALTKRCNTRVAMWEIKI